MAKMGRPKAEINLKLVESLAEIHCTIQEISAVLKIPEGTLKNREDFTTTYKRAVLSGKASLRRTQFRLAEKSAGMAIWLGKQYLDQVDTREIDIPDADKYFQAIASAIIKSDTDPNSLLQRPAQICS